MALSDWGSLSFDGEGKPANGVFASKLGTRVELYKNWLYVSDERMWAEGSFSRPTIAEIRSGEVQLSDVRILAVRGPQQAVFAYVESTGSDEECEPRARRFCGIGCYGYQDDVEALAAIDPPTHAQARQLQAEGWALAFTSRSSERPGTELVFCRGDDCAERRKVFSEKYERPPWVGVQASTLADFLAWLKTGDIPRDYVQKVGAATPAYFNQGDAYFADRLGLKTPVSKPGETTKPIMEEILDLSKKGKIT